MAYIGQSPITGTFKKQSLTTDGSTTSFDLDFTVASTTSIIVSVGGVLQEPEEAYTLGGGGTSITFTAAPASTDTTYVHFLGQAVVQNLTDVNGVEFILDADADTSLTADTDDEVDIKVGGTDRSTIKTTGFHNIDSFKFVAGTGDDLQIYHDGSNSYIANSTGALKIATETSGIAITIGHSTSEVTVADNMTVAGDLTVTGTASFGDTNITNVGSITLDSIANDGTDGVTIDSSTDVIIDAGGADIILKDDGTEFGRFTNNSTDFEIKVSTQDKDIKLIGDDGGSAITALTLDMSAAGAATFNNAITSGAVITSGAGLVIADAGNIGSASDTDAIAISSGGVVTMNQIPVFSAGINVSGGSIAGTLSTAAQANITSLGTLTALTVDDVAVDGKVITMTGSSSDTAVFTAGTNGTLSIVTTDDAAAAANITITADGTAELGGTTVTLNSGGDIVLDADGADVIFKDGGTSILSFTNSSSDAVITASVQDKDIVFKGDDNGSAITALTLDMSEAGAATFNNKIVATELDISGDVDVDGTLEADAITVNGATLTETVTDLVGGMVSSNTETGISVTFEDGDNTLDFALAAAQTTITSLLATDIKIGEDDETKIDFETADTIHFYASNANQVKIADGILAPITDNDVDLGTSSLEFKDLYVDGVAYIDAIGFGSTAITLPTSDGSADQVLTTNGSGTLSFVDNTGGTDWQAVKTGNFTASAGHGVFANTSGGAWTLTLPASPSIGDEVSFIDYAGTFDTYNLTIGRNSSKIHGADEDLTVSVERAANTLVFTDATQGWLLKNK